MIGPSRHGGVSDAASFLVDTLIASGQRVCVVYTNVEKGDPVCDEQTWSYWVENARRDGIELVFAPHDGAADDWLGKARLVQEFLAERSFNLVYFNAPDGEGYYTMLAKQAGLAPYVEQVHCVIAHGLFDWRCDHNEQHVAGAADLARIELARRSAEMADIVIAPSRYILDDYAQRGVHLPPRTYCQAFTRPIEIASGSENESRNGSDRDRQPVDELVFFGRLETRKGLGLFCQALTLIAHELEGRQITFLGPMTQAHQMPSGALAIEQSRAWPCRVRLLTRLGRDAAVDYLKGTGRCAVMPAIADSSPRTIHECLEHGIAFIATTSSGAGELIDRRDRDAALVSPNASALAARLSAILRHGAGAVRPAPDYAKNWALWKFWHIWTSENYTDLAAHHAPQRETDLAPRAEQATVQVIIDNGDASMAALLGNACGALDRLGRAAKLLIITSRRGALRALFDDIVSGRARHLDVDLAIVGPDDLDRAKQVIRDCDIAIFADAKDTLDEEFFDVAHGILMAGDVAALSCFVATQGDANTLIDDLLPCGDLPALAACGHPSGSSVWGVRSSLVDDVLETLTYFHDDYAELSPSQSLGNELLQRCADNGKTVRLVPMVGAIARREAGVARNRHLATRELRGNAQNLGLATNAGPAVLPWYAISQNAGRSKLGRPAQPVYGPAAQSVTHPLNDIVKVDTDAVALMAEIAAATGRLDEALQINSARSMVAPERIQFLKQIRDLAEDRCPELYPASDLTSSSLRWLDDPTAEPRAAFEFFAEDELRQQLLRMRENGPQGVAPRIYLQNCRDKDDLILSDDHFLLRATLPNSPPARAAFLDQPLTGQRLLAANIALDESAAGPASFKMTAVDQTNGDEIGRHEMCLDPGEAGDISVALHGLHIFTTVIVEAQQTQGTSATRSGSAAYTRWSRLRVV